MVLIGAYIFGPSFGYLLGAGSIAVSALISGGIGPWMPFQMMATGLLGLIAGFLPKPKSVRLQILILGIWGVLGSFVYGALMTMWNWPFLAGFGGSLGFDPAAGTIGNVTRFVGYELATGGLLWDLGRAATTSIFIALTAPALLTTLKRAARRAGVELAKD
jgi:energy-coupling factor transport system substrate-specific component